MKLCGGTSLLRGRLERSVSKTRTRTSCSHCSPEQSNTEMELLSPMKYGWMSRIINKGIRHTLLAEDRLQGGGASWQQVQHEVKMAQMAECWTRDQRVVSSTPSRSRGRIFSPFNFLCRLLFSSNPMLLRWHIKTLVILQKVPGAGCTSICWHPWPHEIGVGQRCCPVMVWKSVSEISSHTTHQATLVHSCLNSLSHCIHWSWPKEWN